MRANFINSKSIYLFNFYLKYLVMNIYNIYYGYKRFAGHIDTWLMILESWLSTISIITIGSHIDFNKQFFILHVLAEPYNKEVFNEEKKIKIQN